MSATIANIDTTQCFYNASKVSSKGSEPANVEPLTCWTSTELTVRDLGSSDCPSEIASYGVGRKWYPREQLVTRFRGVSRVPRSLNARS